MSREEGYEAWATSNWSGMNQLEGRCAISNPSIQRWKRHLWAIGGLLLAVVLLVGPFNQGGLVEPEELRVAELSRRLAKQLFDANVAFHPAESLPRVTLGQLGRGELQFTSTAAGFALLGPSDFAGRLPHLLWGVVTLVSLGVMLGIIVGKREQLFGCLTLATLSPFLWQSRLMLGDAPTMGAQALAALGLLVAGVGSVGQNLRVAWFALGLLGLVAGHLAGGMLVGVAVPAIAVGSSLVLSGQKPTERQRRIVPAHLIGAVALVIGGLAGLLSIRELWQGREGHSYWILARLSASSHGGTFAAALSDLIHSAFPWSGLFPMALAGALVVPRQKNAPVRALSLTLSLTCVLSVASRGLEATRGISREYPAYWAIAGLCALSWERFGLSRLSARLGAATVGATAILVYSDFANIPEKTRLLSSLAAQSLQARPGAFAEQWLRLSLGVVLAATSVVVLGDRTRWWRPLSRAGRASTRQAVQRLLSGPLGSILLVVEVLAVAASLMARSVNRGFVSIELFEELPKSLLSILPWSWALLPIGFSIVPLCVAVILVLSTAILDGIDRAMERLRDCPLLRGAQLTAPGTPRLSAEAILLFSALLAGGVLIGLGHFNYMSQQLSAKSAYATFRELAANNGKLGVLGLSERASRYYVRNAPASFNDVGRAAEFLVRGGDEPRYLVLAAETLAELNSAHRLYSHGKNVILAGSSTGRVLLAASVLAPGRKDNSPLSGLVSRELPHMAHPVHAVFESALVIAGWEVRDADGNVVERLKPGHPYQLRLAIRADAIPSGDYQIFVHLDGTRRRQTADHEPLSGLYPTDLWQPGDCLLDAYDFTLETTRHAGRIQVYVGFFHGQTRVASSSAESTNDRFRLGELQVD